MRRLSRYTVVSLIVLGTTAAVIPAAHALLPPVPAPAGLAPPTAASGLGHSATGLLPDIASTAGAVTASATQSLLDQATTRTYWTAQRMSAARPVIRAAGTHPRKARLRSAGIGLPGLGDLGGTPPDPQSQPAPTPVPTPGTTATTPNAAAPPAPSPAAAPARGSSAYRWQAGGSVTRTTGKVFFTLNGGDFVCSASAVRSENRSTVLTAGHCVNSGPGEFATRWIFVPAYRDGTRPFGSWTARRLFAPTAWTERGDLDYDTGFAVVDAAPDGSHLTDAVGGQAIAFKYDRGQYAYSFGYPAVGQYDGNLLRYCQGTAKADQYGSTDQGLPCDMTDGSSGGPWLSRFDPKTGQGLLTSVNSFGYDGMPDVMWGPYFGDEIQSVFGTAEHS
jgi:V8-like Glu-specific endopeptidase